MNKKGQSVLSEHVMIFFVVVAALVAMTTFVQRGLQARIHDTRNYMINGIMNSSVCDANCVAAAGGNITYEYEPYYVQEVADVTSNSQEHKGQTNGQAQEIGAIYLNTINEQSTTMATSAQLPPECSDGVNPKPSYCNSL